MGNGYASQTLVLCLAKQAVSTFAKLFGGRPAEGVMAFIQGGQQANIFSGVNTLKTLMRALLSFDLPCVAVLLDQARNLLP